MDPIKCDTMLSKAASSSLSDILDTSFQMPNRTTSAQALHSRLGSQEKLMDVLAEELHDAVFESPSLLNTVCPLKDNVNLEEDINSLATQIFPSSYQPTKTKD